MRGAVGWATLLALVAALLSHGRGEAGEPTLAEALRLANARGADEHLRAIEMLVQLDSKGSIEALEGLVRRAVKAMDDLTKPLDRADMEYGDAAVEMIEMKLNGEDETAPAAYDAAVARVRQLQERYVGLKNAMRGHLDVAVAARAAFRRFRDPEAIGALEHGALTEMTPTVRLLFLEGLEHPSRASAVPTLLAVLADKDPRARAAAVRALRPFASEARVLEAVKGLAGDVSWAVRLGAYDVVSRAPAADAVPFLVEAAARETGEIAIRVDGFLESLTGQSFRQSPAAWRTWYEQNREAIANGTYVRAAPKEALPDESRTVATFFRIPVESTNVLFAIDFSGSMEEDFTLPDAGAERVLAEFRLPATRLGYAQAELIRAIRGLPDGALFNVIGYNDVARPLSPRMLRASRGTREQAIRWILKPRTQYLTNIYAALEATFANYLTLGGGHLRFLDLPDTILFLTDGNPTRGRFQDTEPMLAMVRMWNAPLDAVVHCVGIGEDHDAAFLTALARETGGYYLDLKKGAGNLVRLPKPERDGADAALDPGAAGTETTPAQRSEVEATAIGLADPSPRVRLRAARALAGKGPAAAPAAPALVRALEDQEFDVQCAASDALVAIGAGAVPPLVEALRSKDAGLVSAAGETLARMGPAAAPAVPALMDLLRDPEAHGRAMAARALGAIGEAAKAAVPLLQAAAKSEDFELSTEAKDALRSLE